MKHLRNIVFCLALSAAGSALADALILKDGTRVEKSDMKVKDGKISRLIKIGGNTAEGTVQISQIASLDWGDPEELTNAGALLAAGKTEEAVAQLKAGKDFFEILKDVPGNWYLDLYLAYVDALNQAGKFEEVVKTLPDLQKQKLTEQQKTKLQIMKLDIDRQTSSNYDSIVSQAEDILKTTDDSSVAASIWSIIGDVYMKKKDYEQALLSYLRITVFYGSQVQKVPDAEMRAALALVKMKRYGDAQKFFSRIIETYPGSPIAQKAEKERAAIGGMKNEDQVPPEAAKADAGKPETAAAAKPDDSTESKK
jgi:tetratricopeptide (TPR) repeat protein